MVSFSKFRDQRTRGIVWTERNRLCFSSLPLWRQIKQLVWTKLVLDYSRALLIQSLPPSLSCWIDRFLLVNFLNCGNAQKLQPCLNQATGQMHRTIDLSLFYRHSVKFSRKPCIPSCTSTWLLTTFSQGNSLDSGRGSLLNLLWHHLLMKSYWTWNKVNCVGPCFWI